MGDLYVVVEVHGAVIIEDHVHVQDEWHATFVVTRGCCDSLRLFLELERRPTITVEGQAPIRVDIKEELRDIFLLAPQGITHAITRLSDVWESHLRVGNGNGDLGALDLLMGDLYVVVEVHGAVIIEDHVHVQDEWHATFVVTRGCCDSLRLFLELESRPTITVEGQAPIRVDLKEELRDIFLLAPQGITHAVT